MAYSTADQIRAVEAEIFEDTTNYADATLLLWASTHADPEIDATLATGGYTVPFGAGVVPEIIQSISAMLAAGYGLKAKVTRSTTRSLERAVELIEDARATLKRIVTGELVMAVAGTEVSPSDAGRRVKYSVFTEEHTNSVFSGPVESWKEPTITRASS